MFISSEAIMLMNWHKKSSNGRNEIKKNKLFLIFYHQLKHPKILIKLEHISNEE